jgi:uridine monophosphate synthetase
LITLIFITCNHHGNAGYQSVVIIFSVCTLTTLLEILNKAGKLNDELVQETQLFISENNTFKSQIGDVCMKTQSKTKILSYGDRIAKCNHSLSKRLFTIMEKKRTNLALSADVESANNLIMLADDVGPYICVLKTHIDILNDYGDDVIQKLTEIADKHDFLIFEDRKFADIGNTVKKQYSGGMYHIADWAHIINAHALPGPGIVDALKQVGLSKERGCLLIAEMSSTGNLAKDDYVKDTVKLAEENSDFVMGFICQKRVSEDAGMVHMTPGVRLEGGGDNLGQQYLTPDIVIGTRMCDVMIVGRGIIHASSPVDAAKQYKDAGYNAYLNLVASQQS